MWTTTPASDVYVATIVLARHANIPVLQAWRFMAMCCLAHPATWDF
jgi:hypothetical protein